MVIYVAPGIMIDTEEIRLFEELAGDVAIAGINKEQERSRLDSKLRI